MRFSSSHVSVLPRPLNANTQLPWGMAEPALDAPALRDAYKLAEGIARSMPAMTRPGYRLFWISGPNFGSIEVPAQEGAYTIIGRHARCDAMLDRDPEIALRHLLVRSVQMPDGTLALRVLDLHTALAFHLEGDKPVRSIFATGPVAVRLGRYAIVALPGGAGDMPAELPPLEVEHAQGSPYRSPSPRPLTTSRVTIMPRVSMMCEMPMMSSALSGYTRVTLERAGRIETLELPKEELDKGILIGRAEKANRHLQALLGATISRVHILLLRDGDQVFAYDTASMHGTYAGGQRVKRVCLPDTGATMVLGHNEVTLRWHPRRA